MESGIYSLVETMKRRLLQLTGVGRWVERAMEKGFAASTKKTDALSV
jgi:hypothetical protein